MELKIDRVSKQYKNKIAVDRLSATLHTGVTGLLGANGAGKTTLMRMICGVLKPTSGEITYNGVPCLRSATGAFWGICLRSSDAIRSFREEIFCSILPH